MSTIASLNVVLTATTGPLTKGLAAGCAAVGAFSQSINTIGSAGSGLLNAVGGKYVAVGAAIAGAVALGIKAAADEGAAIKKLDAVLASTGNSTGVTRDEMLSLAASLEKTTNFSHSATIAAEAALSAFEGIHGDNFKQALKSAQDLAAFTGSDLNSAVEKVGRALENPARGIKALGKEGFISPQQQASIGQLLKAGNSAAAQAQILGALQGRLGGIAESMASPMKQLRNSLMTALAPVGQVVKSVFSGLAALVRPVVDSIGDALKTIVPIASRIFGWLGGIVRGAFNGIVSFAAPIWNAFATFVGTAITSAIDFLAPVIVSLGDLVGDVFGAIIDIAQGLWQGISDAFTAIVGVVGDALNAIGINFNSISNGANSMMGFVQGALIVLEFGFSHWRELVELVTVGAIYQVVKFANEVVYFFSVMVPAYVDWFGKHWTEVWTDIWEMLKTVSSNIWTNLTNLWTSITNLFKGKGFHFTWTPLTEGFKSAITELPNIAERQMGPLESSLKNQITGLAANVDKDFSAFADERTKKVADQANGVRDKLKKEGLIGLIPKIPDAAKLGGAGLNKPGQGLAGAGGGEVSKLGALVRGSEEAFKATHGVKDANAQLLAVNQQQLGALNRIAANTGAEDMDDTVDLP